MFILRSLLVNLQTEFKDKNLRGTLFVYTLISIILPFMASCNRLIRIMPPLEVEIIPGNKSATEFYPNA